MSATERHYTPQEVAAIWGVSTDTARTIFANEPGVVRLANGSRTTLRIPQSVMERVQRQYPQRKHVSYRKQDLRGSQELPELRQLRGKQDIYSTQDLARAIAAGLRDWIFRLRLFGYRMRAARQARQFGRAIHGQENQ